MTRVPIHSRAPGACRARLATLGLVATSVATVVLAGCGGGTDTGPSPTASPASAAATTPDTGTSPDPTSQDQTPGPTATTPPVDAAPVQLVTHDSFNLSEDVLASFTEQTGHTVEVLASGDAVTMVNQAVLSAGNPLGDVLFGVDNTLLSRALEADLFVAHEPAESAALDPDLVLDDQWRVTPVDRGDVCLNTDISALADEGLDPPESLAELTEPQWAGKLVVEDPTQSSPGLAFLLATVETFGEDGWEQYWTDLMANDVAVAADWTDAYYGQFSGSAGSEGTRPLVVSYASSPPAEIIFAEEPLDEAPTGVVTAGCFGQIEFAGVLAGTDNEAGARALVDFLVSEQAQADIPLQMFVFPARTDVDLPAEFVEHTVVPDDPIRPDPAWIEANRDDLLQRWTTIVNG